MKELICSECKGRKFRKISATEYECEYCGAIIKEEQKATPEKIVIIQQSQPQPIVTPFPSEISFAASLREGIKTYGGKLKIYPDKFIFEPHAFNFGGNLSNRQWEITDIIGYSKGLLTLLDFKMNNHKTIHLAINKKRSIINELEARRKFWLEQQSK